MAHPTKHIKKSLIAPNKLIICEQIIVELRSVFERKFLKDIQYVEEIIISARFEIVKMPPLSDEISEELKIRDLHDRPIIRAAIFADIDIFVSGDKDFLESGIIKPKIMKVSEFLEI